MSRLYDNQRVLYEDPEKIEKWFYLVRNTIAKYSIRDEDIYNFDETGFLMGIISKTLVVTSSDCTANAKLIQPGNREWVTVSGTLIASITRSNSYMAGALVSLKMAGQTMSVCTIGLYTSRSLLGQKHVVVIDS